MDLPEFLKDRYKEWKKNSFPKKEKLFKSLEEKGQQPLAMVVSCCDSRVLVSKIFNSNEGEFFIHRNIANLIPSFNSNKENGTLSAVEYGIKELKIKNLIILGHSSCGGIKHAHKILSNRNYNENPINNWIQIVKPAYEKVDKNLNEKNQIKSLEKLSIINSIQNLNTSTILNDLILKKQLRIYGLWFDISAGSLMMYDDEKEKFQSII